MSEGSHDFVKNIDDLREVLGVVADKVPGLLRGLRNVMYSTEAAENMAGAVATFYTKLVDAGIPKKEAMDMTRGYMINLRDLIGGKGGIHIGNFMDKSKGEDD